MLFYGILITLFGFIGCGSGGSNSSSEEPIPEAPPTRAQYYDGVAMLAAMLPAFNAPDAAGRTPCDKALEMLDATESPALAVLWGTFGDDLTCLKKFTEKLADRPHLLEIHLSNETCRRNGICRQEELFPGLSWEQYNTELERENPAVKARIETRLAGINSRLNGITQPTTLVALSLGLENHFTRRALEVLVSWVRPQWQGPIINNPVDYGALETGGADYLEKHAPRNVFGGAPCMVSEDGLYHDGEDSLEFFDYHRFCAVRLAWRPEWQGREEGVAPTPPKTRTPEIKDADIAIIQEVFAATAR